MDGERNRLRWVKFRQTLRILARFLASADSGVIARVRVIGGANFFEEAIELQLLIDLLELRDLRLRGDEILQLEFNWNRDIDGRQLLAHQNLVAVVLQTFAIRFPLHFGGMLDSRFHRSEALDQIPGSFFADARSSGDVIHRIAHQRKQIRYLAGLHAHELLGSFRVVPDVFLHRVVHMDPIVHQLQHVLVARNDHHIRHFRSAAGQRADHVIRLESRELENGDAHGFERAPDVGDLLAQIWRHFGAVGLVLLVHLFAEGFPGFENRRDVFRFVRGAQLPHHIVKDVDCLRGYPSSGAHGRRAAAGARMIGAEDKAVAVNQEKARALHLKFRIACARTTSATV